MVAIDRSLLLPRANLAWARLRLSWLQTMDPRPHATSRPPRARQSPGSERSRDSTCSSRVGESNLGARSRNDVTPPSGHRLLTIAGCCRTVRMYA